MTCPPYVSFFRRLIGRPLLLSCALALSVVTTIATVSGLASASRLLAARAVPKYAAAVLPAPGATATFNINANGAKEVTSTGTPNQGDLDGTAIGTITFDNGTGAGTTGSAVINLTLTNLDVGTIDLTGHHIHQAPSTTTGPIVIDFGDPDTIRSGNTLSGTITGLPAATITSLMTNSSGFYYNLHNAQFTGGAVRDQLGDASQTGPTLTVNSTADPGDGVCTTNNCTLREAITAANTIAGANTITFDPIVFAAPGPYTINLSSRLPDLITDITITGPGANILTVNRNAAAAFRIFTIHGNATVQIHGLTLTNGNDGPGGAILVGFNSSDKGTLTLTNVAVTNNTATSTISGGGGINLLHGALTVINSTISGNHAPNASSSGGGGGLWNQDTVRVVNSTISGNDSNNYGGGILNFNGTVTLSNSTIANNTAVRGGGLLRLNGTTTLKSTIVADNTASTNPDVDANGGAILSDGFNLVENTGSATITQNGGAGPNITGVDPQLNPLANNGGETQTHSLKTNSPAIDKGKNFAVDASNNPINTDQRGEPRPFNTAIANATGGDGSDIGACEAQAAEVDADNDGTPDDVDTDDDNDGVIDTNDLCPETPASVTVNSSGCTVFTVNSVDDDAASGSTSNGICTTGQTVPVNSVSVPECTLRAAIQEANGSAGADVITFDPVVFATAGGPYTIQLATALPNLTTNMTITGSGANVLTVRRNAAASFRIFTVHGNSTVRISGLTMTNGNQGSGGALLVGFGAADTGTVTLANVAVTNNTAPNTLGGGIAVGRGSLTLIDSTVSGNHSNGVGGGGGGGIGVINDATVSVVNSTISGNDSTTFGGGLYSTGMALVAITNSTVANNTAPQGGGLYTSGTINVGSTIVADNSVTAGGTGPDLNGVFNSLDYNLFENTSGATFTGTTTHDITGQDPLLLPLANYGGPTDTHLPQPGSPALNVLGPGSASELQQVAVNGMSGTFTLTFNGQTTSPLAFNASASTVQSALNGLSSTGGIGGSVSVLKAGNVYTVTFGGALADADQPQMTGLGSGGTTATVSTMLEGGTPATDQRGFPRVVGSAADIGAVEVNYALVVTAGNNQTATTNTAFGTQLQATITESGINRSGISVTFTAPASGASGTFQGTGTNTVTVITDSNGVATAPVFTANSTGGSYSVIASIGTGLPTASFSLTNNPPPIITAASGLSIQQGLAASNSQIATVTDDGGNGNVTVTVTTANPSNGVTISNIVNTNGQITADISADCTASDASFTLQASDGTAITTATLNITVTANTAPVLTYDNQTVDFKGSLNISPATGPSDNASVSDIVVHSTGSYTGTISVDKVTGVVSISNAVPAGTHTITIRATDDCGSFTDATFTLTVNSSRGWTINGAGNATEDESNPARPTYTNFTAAANAGSPAGTYILRYNIPALNSLNAPEAVNTRLRIRFRDEGAGSQVIVVIMRTTIFGGVATHGTIFDSDAYTPGTGFQTQEILMPPLAFDFTQNMYWLEVRLIKASSLNQPGFGSAQINQQ